MTRQELYKRHKQITAVALQIMEGKNVDYAHQDDPFRNFRTFGELGILVRMSDKLARLRSVTENGRCAVATESVYDTVLDLINYAVLFQTYLEDVNEPQSLQTETAFSPNVGPLIGVAPSVDSVPAPDGDSTPWTTNTDLHNYPGSSVVVRRDLAGTPTGKWPTLQSGRNDRSQSDVHIRYTIADLPGGKVHRSHSD